MQKKLVLVGVVLLVVGVWQFPGVIPGAGAENSGTNNSSTPTEQHDGDVVLDPDAMSSTGTPPATASRPPSTATPVPPATETPAGTPGEGEQQPQQESNSTANSTDSEPEGPQVNETYLEERIVALINQERSEDDLAALGTTSTTHRELYQMAANHTAAMATNRTLAHRVNGTNSADRYRQYGLYDRCEYIGDGNYIESADNNGLEAIARVAVTQNESGEWDVDRNEIAGIIVGQWVDDDTLTDTLWINGPEHIAVAVDVNRHGEVYATANVC